MNTLDITWALAPVGLIALAVSLRLGYLKYRYRKHGPSLHDQLPVDQLQRYSEIPHAVSLQKCTNLWHSEAVRQKGFEKSVELAVALVAPVLVLAAGIDVVLTQSGFSPNAHDAYVIQRIVVVALVLLAHRHFKRSPFRFVDTRLRAEGLRLLLHCAIARIGFFATDKTAEEVDSMVQEVLNKDPEQFLERARINLITSLFDGSQSSRSSQLTVRDARVYVRERVNQQIRVDHSVAADASDDYFSQRASDSLGSLSLTDRISSTAWQVAGPSAIIVAVAHLGDYARIAVIADALMFVSAATLVLVIGLRSVFKWDFEERLYSRQNRLLQPVAEIMADMIKDDNLFDADSFARAAISFEELMAREARDWALVHRTTGLSATL